MIEFDVVVVGNGLFGSAAARHLSLLGERVALIGPDEPGDPARHDGVFASHYDQGRLTRLIDRNPVWAPLTRRALSGYAALEDASGIKFHHPVGALIVGNPADDLGLSDPLVRARADGITHDLYQPGDKAWQVQFPDLDFPDTHYVIHEPAPAGFVNPGKLIEAQNVVAAAHGAVIIREMVIAVRSTPRGVVVDTDSGSKIRAGRVLVAAGAFANFNDLLSTTLPLTLETEIIALGRVGSKAAEQLGQMPTVKYMIDDPVLSDIYMVPPVRYPDGRHYVKVGANTASDRNLSSLADVQAWFREGDSDIHQHDFEGVLRAMWPTTEFLSVDTKRCIVCRTPSGGPIIDQIDESTFVATGGNGAGAKGSDVWGELAAGVVHDGRWPADVPRFT